MTKKELFKGKIIELFNSVLPNNAIDDFSLEVVQTANHTSLFSLLNYLEDSELPPICTRETDDAVHIIYPNITYICPYDFKAIKLFFNSEVKIYIKHPEYIELEQFADFLMQVDSEMLNWSRMWSYFHDIEILKAKDKRKLDERSRKLISNIMYLFEGRRIDRQRLQYYNIQTSILFLEHDNRDYVYQKSEDMIVRMCEDHNIRPNIDEWKHEFDNILRQRELQYLIAEEKKNELKRKNTKIRHLLTLGLTRLKVAIGGIDFHENFSVKVSPVHIDLTSPYHDLLTENYIISVFVDSSMIHITIPYIDLNKALDRLVKALTEMNDLIPQLSEELRRIKDKYVISTGSIYDRNEETYPFCLLPAGLSRIHWIYNDFHTNMECPKNETLMKINRIYLKFMEDIGRAG